MVGESLAIIAVIIVMAIMYLRSGRLQMAGLALPLVCLPLAHLLGVLLWNTPRADQGLGLDFIYRCMILGLGLVLSLVFSIVMTRKTDFKRGRVPYIALSGIFSAGLMVAYILYLV